MKTIAGMKLLNEVHWRQAKYGNVSDIFSKQEAHSSAVLTTPSMQKILVILPGWGEVRHDIETFDITNLPLVKRMECKANGKSEYFRYGRDIIC